MPKRISKPYASGRSIRYLNSETGGRRILAARMPRRSVMWRLWARRGVALAVLLGLATGLVASLAWGMHQVGRRLLWENDDYLCRTFEVTVAGDLPPDNILEFLGLHETVNLWALLLARRVPASRLTARSPINIDQMRERFLLRVPSIATMEIAVRLPDRLEIRATERVPLAIVEASGSYNDFAVDRHGMVFFAPRQDRHLPVISGLSGVDIRPGVDLSETLAAPLRLLDLLRHPEFSRTIRVRRLDVQPVDYIACLLDVGTRVHISWADMDKPSPVADGPLKLKLGSLRSVLNDNRDRGRTPLLIDLTLTEDNIPVTLN